MENKHKYMKALKEKVDELEKKVTELTNKTVNIEAKKVEPLEKVVKVMCRKVLDLQRQIKYMKTNNMSSESAKETSVSNIEEDNNIENKKNNSMKTAVLPKDMTTNC